MSNFLPAPAAELADWERELLASCDANPGAFKDVTPAPEDLTFLRSLREDGIILVDPNAEDFS